MKTITQEKPNLEKYEVLLNGTLETLLNEITHSDRWNGWNGEECSAFLSLWEKASANIHQLIGEAASFYSVFDTTLTQEEKNADFH